MSQFCFIASDKELPNADYTKSQTLTLREVKERGLIKEENMPQDNIKDWDTPIMRCYESYEDFHDLQIHPWHGHMGNVEYYTDKPFIYEIIFRYSERSTQHLIEYLQTHIHTGESLDLWRIWLDDFEEVQPKKILLKHLKVRDLKKWSSNSHSCLHIQKED